MVKGVFKIIEKKLSVRQTENFVKIFKKKGAINKYTDPNIKNLEENISQKIGLNVSIKNNKKNEIHTTKKSDIL